MLAGVAIAALAVGAPAYADTLDPLHGYLWTQTGSVDTTTTATEVGGITPLGTTTDFGFDVSPGPKTGTQYIAIVLPGTAPAGSFSVSTVGPSPTSFGVTQEGTLGAFTDPPTTNTLEGFLSTFVPRIGTASPNNPIGNLEKFDTANKTFTVYLANLGIETLAADSCVGVTNTCGEDLTIGGDKLPLGAFIVSFLDTGTGNVIGTANSGDLFVNQLAATPLPAALPLFAGGLGLMGWLTRRRKRVV
jgi:hypothetical protein